MSWFPEIQEISKNMSIPLDIFKILVGFLVILFLSSLVINLGSLYRFFQSKTARNLLSISVGVMLLLFIIEEWAVFVLLGIIAPYFLMIALPHPFIVSILCSSLLLVIVHSHRFMVAYMEWKVDCSVYIMFLVTKLTYYGKWLQNLQNKKEANLLDYLGYNLFFPSVLSGPTFSYQTFLTYIDHPEQTTINSLKGIKAIRPLALGLFCAFLAVYFMPIFTPTWVIDNLFYRESSILVKVFLLIPLGFFYRSKYYAAWYIGQTAVNLSGLSQTSDGNYDRVRSVSIRFETEPNPKLKTEHWNSEVQLWLKNIVYDSISPKVTPTLALFFTFFISACWHGFYLTYYLCFAEWAVLNHITKWCYKWSLALPVNVGGSILFQALTWLASCLVMNTIGMVAVILEWQAALQFYSDLYYLPIIVLGAILILSLLFKPPSPKPKKAQ